MDIEVAKKRCLYLLNESLPSLPPSKISPSSKLTLHRLLSAELRFLSHLSSSSYSSTISLNLGYLDAIITTIHHPSIHTITRVCKTIASLHVDIACTFSLSPSWFFVSHRNPISILPSTLSPKLLRILSAAHSTTSLKPDLLFFVFARGASDAVARKLLEFGANEIDLLGFGRAFEIILGLGGRRNEKVEVLRGLEVGEKGALCGGGDRFRDLVTSMRVKGDDDVELVNFDTTALVAMVSGISNGGCERLMRAPEVEMRTRFKGNYEFVIAQVLSELEHPILSEFRDVIAGTKGIICESVCSEFKELVLMCGGPNEKLRADLLLKHLSVVPDNPSERVAVLPTTRKIALKNKIVFGTGDHWYAPTMTANMGFVRAISQTGMSLFTIEHRPCALTGD